MLDTHLVVKTRPIANNDNIIYWKDYRITVLFPRLFRIEKNPEKIFRDDATQSIWYRDTDKVDFELINDENQLIIDTYKSKLIIKEKRSDCRIQIGNRIEKIDNRYNLKGTYRTLDCYDGKVLMDSSTLQKKGIMQLENGVCSKNGIAVIEDQDSLSLDNNGKVLPKRGNGSDEYVFAYGNNYKDSIKALYYITGFTPLIPRFALGNWWSRYHKYTDKEYLSVLNEFEERNIPLSVATIDMDWHYSTPDEIFKKFNINDLEKEDESIIGSKIQGWNIAWTGYCWNKELFPNHVDFLNTIKNKNLKITLNLHPSGGFRFWDDCYKDLANALNVKDNKCIPFDLSDSTFINAYFKYGHKPFEKEGVDFWWIDWQQGTKSKMENLDPLWALNHYHFYDNKKNHLILSRYAGIGSHRYPLGFSGDTFITWNTLRYLPEFTSTASNIGYTWWSHDIGGHMLGIKDSELYLRMLQFGVFSPINRLHCCDFETVNKSPWFCENGIGLIATEWMRLRHELIPFIHSINYKTHKYGDPLIEPLYYYYDVDNAYKYKNEYFFGKDLLVIPVTNKKTGGMCKINAWIPKGKWTDIFTGDVYNIKPGGEKKVLIRDLRYIPVLARTGSIIPLSGNVYQNGVDNPSNLKVSIYEGNGSFTMFEGNEKENCFTKFNLSLSINNNKVIQTLSIKSDGNKDVIPNDRKIKIYFKNVTDYINAKLIVDGKEANIKNIPLTNATFEIDYNVENEYTIILEYYLKNNMDNILSSAKRLLTEINGNNCVKNALWNEIKKCQNEDDYAKIIDKSTLKCIDKLRLKEFL